MAKRKASPRSKPAAADEPLRRDRGDERRPSKKPDVAAELLHAARVARESQIFPGIPLS
jgi:hypothetical protein